MIDDWMINEDVYSRTMPNGGSAHDPDD